MSHVECSPEEIEDPFYVVTYKANDQSIWYYFIKIDDGQFIIYDGDVPDKIITLFCPQEILGMEHPMYLYGYMVANKIFNNEIDLSIPGQAIHLYEDGAIQLTM